MATPAQVEAIKELCGLVSKDIGKACQWASDKATTIPETLTAEQAAKLLEKVGTSKAGEAAVPTGPQWEQLDATYKSLGMTVAEYKADAEVFLEKPPEQATYYDLFKLFRSIEERHPPRKAVSDGG